MSMIEAIQDEVVILLDPGVPVPGEMIEARDHPELVGPPSFADVPVNEVERVYLALDIHKVTPLEAKPKPFLQRLKEILIVSPVTADLISFKNWIVGPPSLNSFPRD